MNDSNADGSLLPGDTTTTALSPPVNALSLALPPKAQDLLLRMFADPYLLDPEARTELVRQLKECSVRYPDNSDLRVLLGMALCVNLEPQAAIAELSESVRLDPQSFIAQLKLGELWMRLRACDKAEEHTRQAALLAQNLTQSELARRQAASLRTMKREGIERGGYHNAWQWLTTGLARLRIRSRGEASEASVALDLG